MTITETLTAIGDYLDTLTELKGIGVVVDKQQSMDEEMKKSIQRSKGYVVIIGEVDNRSKEDELDAPRLELVFGVSVYSPHVVKDGETTGASLRDVILRKIHNKGIIPTNTCYDDIYYKDGKCFIEQDKQGRKMMIHAMKFKTVAQY